MASKIPRVAIQVGGPLLTRLFPYVEEPQLPDPRWGGGTGGPCGVPPNHLPI